MDYKVIIDAAGGGTDNGASANDIVGKDYALQISKYISERLNTLGITNSLVRDSDESLSAEERVNRIKSKYGTGSDVIVISNQLNSGGGDRQSVLNLYIFLLLIKKLLCANKHI